MAKYMERFRIFMSIVFAIAVSAHDHHQKVLQTARHNTNAACLLYFVYPYYMHM